METRGSIYFIASSHEVNGQIFLFSSLFFCFAAHYRACHGAPSFNRANQFLIRYHIYSLGTFDYLETATRVRMDVTGLANADPDSEIRHLRYNRFHSHSH